MARRANIQVIAEREGSDDSSVRVILHPKIECFLPWAVKVGEQLKDTVGSFAWIAWWYPDDLVPERFSFGNLDRQWFRLKHPVYLPISESWAYREFTALLYQSLATIQWCTTNNKHYVFVLLIKLMMAMDTIYCLVICSIHKLYFVTFFACYLLV